MFTNDELSFYSRQLLLENFGKEAQVALKKAKVLVVGAGGLGCPVLMYLTGAGVGTIGIVDGDKVHISNLHRQTLFGHSQLGNFKPSAAIDRLSDVNPYINHHNLQFFMRRGEKVN